MPTFSSMSAFYRASLTELVQSDTPRSPRGYKTREITHAQFSIRNSQARVLLNSARAINPRFLIAELLWIWNGLSDATMPAYYAPKFHNFAVILLNIA